MLLHKYLSLTLIFFSTLVSAQDGNETPSIDRDDLVGHYIGSDADFTVALELSPYVFKQFNFNDFVTIETYDEGDMGYWKINGSMLELVDTDLDTPNQQLKIQGDGTLLYGPDGLVLKPVGPNFLGMLFHFNRTLKDASKAAHYRSDGVLLIQQDFTGGKEPEFSNDALHLHNMGYMYESGTKYMGGRDEGLFGMTDEIPDDEKREGLIDYEKAYEYYLKAAEKGYVQSMYNLAVYHEKGRHVAKDLSKAVGWYRKAADYGHTYSENALAHYLYTGAEGVPANEAEAAKYWRSAANKGSAAAQYNLARLLSLNPDSTDADLIEARDLLRRAALRDNPAAFFSLFNILLDESGDWEDVNYDFKAVVFHFLIQSAYLGNPQAQDYFERLQQRAED